MLARFVGLTMLFCCGFLIDALTTASLYRVEGVTEVNPFIEASMKKLGPIQGVFLAKCVLSALVILFLFSIGGVTPYFELFLAFGGGGQFLVGIHNLRLIHKLQQQKFY